MDIDTLLQISKMAMKALMNRDDVAIEYGYAANSDGDSIRHLFATVTLSMGADLAAVSKILGHCSTKMTADTYYHLLEGEKVRAVGLIPQIGV